MTDLVITGAENLDRLARALKQAGRGDLRKELLKGIREAAKPAKQAVQQSARSLDGPSSTGLSSRIASAVTVRTRATGNRAGVRIAVISSKLPDGKQRLPGLMNKGQWRHPVYGTDAWVTQTSNNPGWWDDPLRRLAPSVRADVMKVMRKVADDIMRSV